VLDAGQLDVLLSYGTEQVVEAGEVLFAEGDKAVDLIVVERLQATDIAVAQLSSATR
jgi:hypothetical protein